MTNKKMVFPVLGFSQGVIEAVLTDDDLTTCSRAGLRWYRDLTVIDSAGHRWQMDEAVRASPPLGIIGRLADVLRRRIRIRLVNMRYLGAVTLQTFQETVCSLIDKGQDFWSSGSDVEELKSMIRDSRSHGDLIKMFSDRTKCD